MLPRGRGAEHVLPALALGGRRPELVREPLLREPEPGHPDHAGDAEPHPEPGHVRPGAGDEGVHRLIAHVGSKQEELHGHELLGARVSAAAEQIRPPVNRHTMMPLASPSMAEPMPTPRSARTRPMTPAVSAMSPRRPSTPGSARRGTGPGPRGARAPAAPRARSGRLTTGVDDRAPAPADTALRSDAPVSVREYMTIFPSRREVARPPGAAHAGDGRRGPRSARRSSSGRRRRAHRHPGARPPA